MVIIYSVLFFIGIELGAAAVLLWLILDVLNDGQQRGERIERRIHQSANEIDGMDGWNQRN